LGEFFKWIRQTVEEVADAKSVIAVVFALSVLILLLLPDSSLKILRLHGFVVDYGPYLGFALVVSGFLLMAMAAGAVSRHLHLLFRNRQILQKAETSYLTEEHHVLLHFLMRRHPSSERLFDEHPAVFRLWQLELIKKADSLIYVLPDPCSSYTLTRAGETYASRHHDGVDHLRQAELEELIHAMTGRRFRLTV
jgi:hypothetical protein